MELIEQFYIYFVIIQLLHSQEEIHFHFEKVWPLWKMSRKFFITMEITLSLILISGIFVKEIPYRFYLMAFFNILMFANGTWHITGAALSKKYIPGLYTAPFAVILFLIYYYLLIIK